jgi:hypothetical protein
MKKFKIFAAKAVLSIAFLVVVCIAARNQELKEKINTSLDWKVVQQVVIFN